MCADIASVKSCHGAVQAPASRAHPPLRDSLANPQPTARSPSQAHATSHLPEASHLGTRNSGEAKPKAPKAPKAFETPLDLRTPTTGTSHYLRAPCLVISMQLAQASDTSPHPWAYHICPRGPKPSIERFNSLASSHQVLGFQMPHVHGAPFPMQVSLAYPLIARS